MSQSLDETSVYDSSGPRSKTDLNSQSMGATLIGVIVAAALWGGTLSAGIHVRRYVLI
jgi:hypothetical protein